MAKVGFTEVQSAALYLEPASVELDNINFFAMQFSKGKFNQCSMAASEGTTLFLTALSLHVM